MRPVRIISAVRSRQPRGELACPRTRSEGRTTARSLPSLDGLGTRWADGSIIATRYSLLASLTRRPSPAPMVLEGRGCDGYAGASSATLGPAPPGPGLRLSLPGNPVGLPETLLGSLGSPCGTRVTAFSAPAAPFRPAAALWALPSAADPVTPGTRPHQHAASLPVRRLLATPVAASGRPVAGKDGTASHAPKGAGISAGRARCAWCSAAAVLPLAAPCRGCPPPRA